MCDSAARRTGLGETLNMVVSNPAWETNCVRAFTEKSQPAARFGHYGGTSEG